MGRKLLSWISLIILTIKINKIESSTTTTTKTSDSKTTLTPPVRVKNLDYWDEITLSTYLHVDPKAPNDSTNDEAVISKEISDLPDAVIMFYAQWSQNSHSLAPLYDKIATLVNAGYADSNRIMALYDCESNTLAKQICQAADVTTYPTLMYVSQDTVFHDTDWFTSKLFGLKRSCGPMGCTKKSHTVKFQGDWRYGEQIYDWIIVMGGLSKWSKWSKNWKDSWKNRRAGGSKKSLSAQPLPVGVSNNDSGTSDTTSSTTKSTTTGDEQLVSQLQSKLEEVQKKSAHYQDATKHAGLLIDSILFHGQNDVSSSKTNGTSTSSDPFVIIHQGDLWNKFHMKLPKEESIILSCVMDLSIDYCTRHTINQLHTNTTLAPSENKTTNTNVEEPFCNIIDKCLKDNFQPKECQPASCPFNNEFACNYVSSCLNSKVQKEYAIALKL